LDELQARGFINEERVVESVVHRRASKLGTARVEQELMAKGLSSESMTEALEQLRSTELERAREVWSRKFDAPSSDPKERARQIRFLLSRGFASDVVRKVTSR
jgi:regulatory protein